jgi:Amt family ammonium transporter
VFVVSFVTFAAIKYTIGLRVSPEQEEAGLDIVEHGMYGYPEQFIPDAELAAYGAKQPGTPMPAAMPVEVPA